MLLDVLTHQIDLVECQLNGGWPKGLAGNENGEKLGIETAFSHAGNVDVAFRIPFAKIKCAGKQTLRSIGMSIEND